MGCGGDSGARWANAQSSGREHRGWRCYPDRATRPLRGGFTLIEALIAVTILAVMMALALPSFAALLRDVRIQAATNDLHTALFVARTEAVRRGVRVTVCTSADGLACAQGIGWHRGWLVFVDGNGNGVRDSDEPVIRVGEGLAGDVTALGNTPVRDYVSYLPQGMTRMTSGALQIGRIHICSDGVGREIVINAAGRPRVIRDGTCGA